MKNLNSVFLMVVLICLDSTYIALFMIGGNFYKFPTSTMIKISSVEIKLTKKIGRVLLSHIKNTNYQ